ncbi:DUF2586 family protein [Tenacibaculum maritimum]|nr:DUF2586 family protein [Tenacibaculum maritimum]MDB0610450.1 DUF2586 family protein [Tenacibaculum maritimum]
MLPNITIKFDNGNLDTIVSTADGVFGLLASSVAVADTFKLDTPYAVKGMSDVANLGILPDVNNYKLYHSLREFYEEAGEGNKLWLMGFDKATKVSDWFTVVPTTGKAPVEKLLDKANGEIKALFPKFSPAAGYAPTIQDAMDGDVFLAKQKAQLLAKNYTDKKFSPFYVVLEAYAFTGVHTDLVTLLEGSDNRVGIFIGDTQTRTATVPSLGASNHILAGRRAKIQVHESSGKVKTGALASLNAYVLDTPVEDYDVESLHDKGYITFRTHARKSGYYISDDPLATDPTNDDYNQIPLREVIDKAYRLAHNIASDEILTDFDLNKDGTISPFFAKTVEGNIEREIAQQMTANGELSVDASNKDDFGVTAKFDTTKNVSTTSRIELTLKVRPKGYARWFDILLGYDVTLNN